MEENKHLLNLISDEEELEYVENKMRQSKEYHLFSS